ncbi:hypothetical protein SLS62_009109 [Diatrype stigma]|uniref:Translation initiation factor 3 N-terminal domain-containing protein n=1 Tax=Diatrype stigma TaxID=117547 RepID=A0AAN9YLG4_9PEZI
MRHTSCAASPARALRQLRQFSSSPASNNPAASLLHHRSKRRATTTTTPTYSSAIFTTSPLPPPPSSPAGARSLTTTAPLRAWWNKSDSGGKGGSKGGGKGGGGKGGAKPAWLKNQHPTNDQIPYMWVRIVQEDQSLSEPMLTSEVLQQLDLSIVMLEMVAPPPMIEGEAVAVELDPETGIPVSDPTPTRASATEASDPDAPAATQTPKLPGPPAAICRIIDKAKAAAALAEAKRLARQRSVNTKELEVNWTIGPHDLGHKLRRMREFLNKGMTVEVMLARKKRAGQQASPEAARAVLDAVRETAAAIPGTRETKKMDGEVGAVVRLFFEGPSESTKRKLREEAKRLAKEEEEVEARRAEAKKLEADHE